MGQEDGDNGTVVAPTGAVKKGEPLVVWVTPVDINGGIVPEDLFHR